MKKILLISAYTVIGISIAMTALTSLAHAKPQNNINRQKLDKMASADGLRPSVLNAALNAYNWALKNHKLGSNKDTLTIVDFALPSYKKRMWVIDLKTDKVLMKLYTTNGFGTFSNKSGTHASCLGLFTTADIYYGRNGKSMRIDGLEKGINNVELIEGNIVKTVPNYAKQHPELRLSLLHLDCTVYEPTLVALENFYDRLLPGGLLLLNGYGKEGIEGETKAVDDFFGIECPRIRKLPFAFSPCYIRKEG